MRNTWIAKYESQQEDLADARHAAWQDRRELFGSLMGKASSEGLTPREEAELMLLAREFQPGML